MINKKITGKIVCLACAVGIITATVFLSGKSDDAITVLNSYNNSDKPVIILDAGHGECS